MWQRNTDINGFSKAVLILFLAFIKATLSQNQCIITRHEDLCMIEAVCNEFITFTSDIYSGNHREHCEQISISADPHDYNYNYNRRNNYALPMSLTYKENSHDHALEIPKLKRSMDRKYYNIIRSLDLSNDKYVQFPLLADMVTLKLLNISFNSISTAKLSSKYNFPRLEEIDLSHNFINEFEIIPTEVTFSNLVKLNISHNKLTEVREALFDLFSSLQHLDMSNNEISHINSFSFEGIKNLVYLNLAHNDIDYINGSLFRFTKLKYLALNNNRILNILFNDFENLVQLEELDLSNNVIIKIDKNTFNTMSLLSTVYLSSNVLKDLDQQLFSNTTVLNIVDLSFNEVQVLPRFLFKGKNISYFDIQGNNLGGALVNGTFEGLISVLELDISHQNLSSIEDYAFTGLDYLEELFLNHNKIKFVSLKSFQNIRNLKKLDLSSNLIANLDFALDNLQNLEYLSLSTNFIQSIKNQYLSKLYALEYLNISKNNITSVESHSFQELTKLVNFDISKNSLTNVLESSTFDGLILIPILDISCSSLTTVQNSSFNDMYSLHTLNISYSTLKEIHFNAFINTGNITVLDLSYNALKYIDFNRTTLVNLRYLFLNHNLITAVPSDLFVNMIMLTAINLSLNDIKHLDDTTFSNCKELFNLDISYNKEIEFNVSLIENSQHLQTLILSGIPKNIVFDNIIHSSLMELNMSNSSISNITSLGIYQFHALSTLSLNKNQIKNVGVGAFSNLSRLSSLDLSFNKLQYIQPGVFKDNSNLYVLNISHNHLTALTYGVFRGLTSLETLDLSYNEIQDLQSERFYDIQNLRVLIIDFNKISKINFEEFGMYLSTLSIGGNPLPCEMLVKLKKTMSLPITAITLDESSNENIDGVTCHGRHGVKWTENKNKSIENDNVLNDIRDILLDLSAKKAREEMTRTINSENNVNKQLEKSINDQNLKMDKNIKNVEDIIRGNNITNTFLERILKMMVAMNSQTTSTQLKLVKENATYENILPYIAQVRQNMENSFTIEKEKIISDFSDKITLINKKIDEASNKPIENPEIKNYNTNSFLFTDICVGLILLILLCFVSFKIYESNVISSRRRTFSTQRITDAVDNSNL